MKVLLIIVWCISCIVAMLVGISIRTPRAFAHAPGQPQVVTIQGKDPSSYFDEFVKESSSFPISNEVVPTPFVLTQSLTFQIKRDRIPLDAEAIKKLTFSWDMGDGKTYANQDTVSHTYAHSGSYMVSVSASAPGLPQEPIESILIHVIPDKLHVLPQAHIQINGQSRTDKNFEVPLSQAIHFEAVTLGIEEVNSVRWSLEKGKVMEGKDISYTYGPNKEYSLVVLEIRYKNGLIAQDYAYVAEASPDSEPIPSPTAALQVTKQTSFTYLFFFLILFGVCMGIALFLLFRLKQAPPKL